MLREQRLKSDSVHILHPVNIKPESGGVLDMCILYPVIPTIWNILKG